MIKKSLGQNFLVDHNIAKKIIKLINDFSNCNLIEVGPGRGFLTEYLIKIKPRKLILIEKDYELFLKLKNKYNKNNVEIYNYDALNTDIYKKIPKPKIIVSNLPYNISLKLITNWLPHINNYIGFYLMVQKEVAERFKYSKTLKTNRLNLLSHLYSDYKKEFDISPNVFYPKPKVYSSFISFKPNLKAKIDHKKFKNFTNILFFSKRKKTINNLLRNKKYKKLLKKDKINELNLSKRPEELSFKEVIKIFFILN